MERRFRLQTVLNYREDLEEALQLELGKLMAEENAARAQLDAFRDESVRTMADTRHVLDQPRPDLAAVQQGFVYLEAVHAAIGGQTEILAEVTRRVEAKRAEVVKAMQARKVLEKLKQRHDRSYAEWVRQVEQALADDVTTIRYSRRLAAGEDVSL
jgi:flagellar FliJ protein